MAGSVSKPSIRRCELMKDVAEEIARELLKISKATEQEGADIGNKIADFLIQHWRGQTIYIPSDWRYKNSARDLEICQRMTRGNAHEIAAEYGISYVRVYQIYARYLEEKRQKSLDAAKSEATEKTSPRRPKNQGIGIHTFFGKGVVHD